MHPVHYATKKKTVISKKFGITQSEQCNYHNQILIWMLLELLFCDFNPNIDFLITLSFYFVKVVIF